MYRVMTPNEALDGAPAGAFPALVDLMIEDCNRTLGGETDPVWRRGIKNAIATYRLMRESALTDFETVVTVSEANNHLNLERNRLGELSREDFFPDVVETNILRAARGVLRVAESERRQALGPHEPTPSFPLRDREEYQRLMAEQTAREQEAAALATSS